MEKWSEFDKVEKATMISHIRDSFKINRDEHVDIALQSEMRNIYRGYRYRLHEHFLKHATLEEAIANRPHDVTEHEWKYLIDHFTSPKFLREEETEVEPNRLELWYETHYNKRKKGWVDEKSEDEEVTELQFEIQINGGEPKTTEEIFDQVLPPKRVGTSEAAKLNEEFRKEAAEAKRRAKAAEKKNEAPQERIHMLESRQASLEESFMDKIRTDVQAGLAAIQRNMPGGIDSLMILL
ncbi:hypothetical protein TorRG33x02_325510, partial [Trema orientale]